MVPSTGEAAGPRGSLVLSAGKWRAHSGFLFLFPPHAGLLWSRRDRSHPGEEGRESPLSRGAAAGTTLPLLPQGQLGQESTGHGCGFSPGRAGAGWWHPRNGTAARVSPWHGHSLGLGTHCHAQTPPWAGLGLLGWGQFTEQITEPGCEPAVSESLCPSEGHRAQREQGGGTDLRLLGKAGRNLLAGTTAFLAARILLPAGLQSWERLPG